MSVAEKVETEAGRDFIRDIVADDLAAGRHKSVVTRFPPEPNGYLHIGHAKSICLNFGIAQEFGGRCHLRFDDTNPTKEEQEYIDAIERDVRWLGFDWGEHLYHASDYFERLYDWAEDLIRAGKAYVDDQTQEEMRAARGTLTEPGKNSPFRERTRGGEPRPVPPHARGRVPERRARAARQDRHGVAATSTCATRCSTASCTPTHPRTGTPWKIYPSYDYAHGQSDAIEGVTHSICTLEFEDHRPLYDWFIENLPVPSRPRQYEFARLNLTYTVLSKRVLNALVKGGHVSGWDDPRMPTLAGMRRRGVPPEALRDFVKRIGVAKANSLVDLGVLDFSIREMLNKSAQRRMAVLRPLKVVIENYEGAGEELEAVNHPDDPAAGTRRVRFGREIYIEQDDFMENPPKKFFRLSPGTEVRLRYAYFITCREVVKDAAGNVIELRCTYDPATRGGNAPDGRKVKATIHWVSAADSVPAEVRLYNPLFTKPEPDVANFASDLNPNSLEVLTDARVEPALAADNSPAPVQFERHGLFRARPGFSAGQAGVQPHRRPARQLRQGDLKKQLHAWGRSAGQCRRG